MRPAGIITHHTTNTTTVAGRCFWAKKEAQRLKNLIKLIPYNTGFHPNPPFLSIDFDNMVEVATNIHNNAIAHHLTCYAGATRSRY